MSPHRRPTTFTERHAEGIRQFQLIAVVLFLVALPVTFVINWEKNADNRTDITKIEKLVESPCQTYGPKSRQCEEAFEAAVASINHREACYVMFKAGLHPKTCDGSHLRSQ